MSNRAARQARLAQTDQDARREVSLRAPYEDGAEQRDGPLLADILIWIFLTTSLWQTPPSLSPSGPLKALWRGVRNRAVVGGWLGGGGVALDPPSEPRAQEHDLSPYLTAMDVPGGPLGRPLVLLAALGDELARKLEATRQWAAPGAMPPASTELRGPRR